VMVLFDASS